MNNNNENYAGSTEQSSQHNMTGDKENYSSQEMNREHSDQVRAGEHNIQDETQYGKIRQSESGKSTEQRADHLRNQVNEGVHKTESRSSDRTNKAEKKMDKAEDKIQDAHEKLGQNKTNYFSANRPTNDNVEDYEHRTGKDNPFDNDNNLNQGGLR